MSVLWKRAAILTLVFAGVTPAIGLADWIQAQPVYARNNSDRPIWVAAEYVPAGGSSLVTDGWWKVRPHQCRLLLYTNGQNIYFAAHDDQGHVWDGDATLAIVHGESVRMFHADTGPCYDAWTMTF